MFFLMGYSYFIFDTVTNSPVSLKGVVFLAAIGLFLLQIAQIAEKEGLLKDEEMPEAVKEALSKYEETPVVEKSPAKRKLPAKKVKRVTRTAFNTTELPVNEKVGN